MFPAGFRWVAWTWEGLINLDDKSGLQPAQRVSFHLFNLPFSQRVLLCLVEYLCLHGHEFKTFPVRLRLGERCRREGSDAPGHRSCSTLHCSCWWGKKNPNGEMFRQAQKNKTPFLTCFTASCLFAEPGNGKLHFNGLHCNPRLCQ